MDIWDALVDCHGECCFAHTCTSIGYIYIFLKFFCSRIKLLSHMATLFTLFKNTSLFKMDTLFPFPLAKCEGSSFFVSSPTLVTICLMFIVTLIVSVKWL